MIGPAPFLAVDDRGVYFAQEDGIHENVSGRLNISFIRAGLISVERYLPTFHGLFLTFLFHIYPKHSLHSFRHWLFSLCFSPDFLCCDAPNAPYDTRSRPHICIFPTRRLSSIYLNIQI
jgi:hypothetical protein